MNAYDNQSINFIYKAHFKNHRGSQSAVHRGSRQHTVKTRQEKKKHTQVKVKKQTYKKQTGSQQVHFKVPGRRGHTQEITVC